MATRVNKKLLVIVFSCSAIAIGVVGLVAYQKLKGDPMRNIRAGDNFVAQGEYRRASGEYRRAIGKRIGEIAFYEKYLDAMSKVVPTSVDDAQENYGALAAFMLKEAQVARSDEALWRRVLNERHFQSELIDNPGGWNSLATLVSDEMEQTVVGHEKLELLAGATRGYALARRLAALSPDEVSKTVELLEKSAGRAADEDQDLAYGGLLTIRLSQALAATRAGQQRQAADAWKGFDELLDRATKAQPNGFQVHKHTLQRLATSAAFNVALPAWLGGKVATESEISAAAGKVGARAGELGTGLALLDAAKSIGMPSVSNGLKMVADLLRTYVQKNPNAIAHRQALAICLQQLDPAEAEKEALALIELPQVPVSLMAAVQSEIRAAAAQQLFDLDFSRASAAPKGPEQAQHLAKLDASLARVKDLARSLSDDSIVLKAEGKRAFVAGDPTTAYAKLNDVIRKGTLVEPETFYLLSVLAEERGETGLAHEYVQRGMELAPGNMLLLERGGALALRSGRFAAAKESLAEVVARDPKNENAKRMLAAAERGITGASVDVSSPLLQDMAKADQLRLKGDHEAALKIARKLLEENPSDLRVLVVAAMCEADAKNFDAAKALVERGYKLDPENQTLRSIEMLLSGDDPVVRLQTAVVREHPEEPDRTVWTAIRLQQLKNGNDAEIKRMEGSNDPELARRKSLAPGIDSSLAEWKAKAEAVGALHPAWLDFRLTNALLDKDFATAATVIADAERNGKIPTVVALFKARLSLVKGNDGEAITTLQKAIDSNVDDAEIFKLLGTAHERVGDITSALKAYSEAYRRKPTDLSTAKFYVSTLVKAGDRVGALTVLRDARKIGSEDLEIGETWLDLEREIGDRQLARSMRQARYDLVPGDRTNALKFATMLAELEPDRQDIEDSAGRQKYTDQAWRALDERTRQNEIQRVRSIWQGQSDTIYAELAAREPKSVEIALLRASTARRQGRYDLGEQSLRGLIKNAGDQATPQMYVALGIHFTESDQASKANEAFDEAVKRQDPTRREANVAISEYYFQRSMWDKALVHLEAVKEQRSDRLFGLRLAEVYSRLGRFADAKQAIAKATADGNRDVVVDQLEASIAEGEGEALVKAGKIPEALKAYDGGLAAVKRAAAAAPANPVICVQEATLHRRKFDATGDQAALDAGLAAADRGTRLRGDYWAAAQAKSELLLAKGKPGESIVELERFVKSAPSVADGRRRLIEVLYRSGNPARAVEVAKEAIAISPNDPQWRVALAEVHLSADQLDQAISAYEQADRIRPTVEFLSRLTDLRLRQPKPDWGTVLASLREREENVRSSPYLQSAIGAALANNGDVKNGLEVLRSSYVAAYGLVKSNVAKPDLIDSWFANLRLVFPAARTGDAEKFVLQASGDKPTTRDMRWIAELWFATGPDGGSRAVELAEKALATNDNVDTQITARLYDIIGSVKYGSGDCKGGLVAFTKAKETLPEEPSILNNYAFLAAECGDPKEAVAAAEKAVRLASGPAEFLDTLGYAQHKAGMPEAAAESYQQSIKARPSVSAHLHLAQVLLELGRKEDARTHARAAGDLKPDAATQKQINDLIEKAR